MTRRNHATPLGLPGLPPDLATEQAIEWERVAPFLVTPLRAFLGMIMEVRTSHANHAGWLPAQAGYLAIRVPARPREGRRSYIHVLLGDRDLATGEPVEGRNLYAFCVVDADTGEIFKLSKGKALKGARGSILDEASARRAITPFGIESR
jgi:hypothetical protein